MAKIKVENAEITVVSVQNEDYISLTDMAHSQMQEHIVFRWMSLKSTIEYLGEWEMLYNPNFNCTEFDTIRNSAGSNNFVLSVKAWIERTGAIGIMAKTGRYGGTYAHRDIAYHFGMWISPRFQLLLVKEYQRLKSEEQKQLEWSALQRPHSVRRLLRHRPPPLLQTRKGAAPHRCRDCPAAAVRMPLPPSIIHLTSFLLHHIDVTDLSLVAQKSGRFNHPHHIVHITIVQLEQHMVLVEFFHMALSPEVYLTIVRVADNKAIQGNTIIT